MYRRRPKYDDPWAWRSAEHDLDLDLQEQERHRAAFYVQKLKDIFSAYPHFGTPHQPTQVARGVFLGTTADAEHVIQLHRDGITHVINCADRKSLLPRSRRRQPGDERSGVIGYLELDADLDEDYDIQHHFRRTNDYIRRARASGGRVLVVCPGASRSAAVVMGYLLGVKSMYLLEAAKLLKDLRHVALCSDNFMTQIVEYAREHGVLDPKPAKVKAPTYGTARDRKRLLDVHLPEIRIVRDVYKYRFDRYLQ